MNRRVVAVIICTMLFVMFFAGISVNSEESSYDIIVTAPTVTVYVGKEIPTLSSKLEGEIVDRIVVAVEVYDGDEKIYVEDIDTSIEKVYTTRARVISNTDNYNITYIDGTLTVKKASSRPSGGETVITPATGGSTTDTYIFTADISEANNVLYMDFDVPTATSGKYMIVNAYKDNFVVGRKILPVNFTDKLVLMGCTDKPENLKINVWDSLANIKPIADYTEFGSTNENGVQTFEPTKGFPTRYPVSNSIIRGHIAFITAIGEYESMGKPEYEIEVLNSDNSDVIYNFADTVTVKENESIKEIEDSILVDGTEKVEKALVAEYIENLVNAEKTTENFAKRIISYKANSTGRITEISFSAEGKNTGLSYTVETTMQHYDAETKMLGNYSLSDETVIFYMPTAKSEYDIISIDELIQDGKYEVAYFDINDKNNAGLLLITDKMNIIGGDSVAVVKSSYHAVDEEGRKIILVDFLKNGEEIRLSVDAESDVNDVENNPFARGSIFEYSVNAEGYINDAKFCGLADTVALKPATVKEAAKAGNVFATKKTSDAAYTYIAGYVVQKNGSKLTLNTKFNADSGDIVVIPSTANVYTMDVTKSRIVPDVAAIGDIFKCKYYTENGYDYAEDSEDTFVLIKYVGKEITDVVAYYGFAPSTDPMS